MISNFTLSHTLQYVIVSTDISKQKRRLQRHEEEMIQMSPEQGLELNLET